ncbi:hypothetical protein ACFYWY_19875 [Streptomyces sp. NPDC002870]
MLIPAAQLDLHFKTLRFGLVQAAENTGKYAGAELNHLKLF